MADKASNNEHLNTLLASLETNLANLVKARDPATVALAYELQNTIDKIRAELGQIGDDSMALRKRGNE
jgi:hypothetical protein